LLLAALLMLAAGGGDSRCVAVGCGGSLRGPPRSQLRQAPDQLTLALDRDRLCFRPAQRTRSFSFIRSFQIASP